MAITAQDMVDRYLEAELAILQGKEILFNGRKLIMDDLEEIRAGRLEWERRLRAQQSAAAGQPPYALATFR